MKRKPKSLVYTQDCGHYPDQILVCVNASKNEVFKYLKKVKANVDFSKFVLKSEAFENIKTKHKGIFGWDDEISGAFIMLRKYEDTWDYWETLIHELHHAVENLAKRKGFHDEMENKAYLQEYLFRSIRRKLQGYKVV